MPPWNAVNRLQTSHGSPHQHNAAASTSKSFPAPALPHTPDPTPPSSLPTSIPNSPEYVEVDLKGRHHRGGTMDGVSHGGPAKPGRASRTPQKRRAVAPVEYTDSFDDFSDPPEPALSAVHDPVGFPSFRTNGWTQRFPSSDADEDSVRFGSTTRKTTTTMTTTTLRTERRHIRYSFPSASHPHEETHSDASKPRPRTRSHTGRPHVSFAPPFTRSSSTGSSRTRSPSGLHRRAGGSTGARQSHRSIGASEYSPHRLSSNTFPRSASAPFLLAPPSTPATSSPFFRRSSLASASSFAVERRTTMRERDDTAEHAIAKALSDSTLPFFRPVFQSLAFFVVSAIAAITVSAVLATSFSLTFYDDCSRRVGDVQRSLGGSIEGVRAGMGRMIGNAKGALDLAVKAAGANRGMGGRHDASHGDERGRTAMPTVEEQPDSDGEPVKRRKARRRTKQSAAELPIASGWAFKASPPPPVPLGRPGSREEGELADAAGWGTDDDALPFDVPHPTPRHSRPASPHRSRQASGTASASTLPPRPPLAFLIPSILFALVFAFARVVGEVWKGKNAGSHGPSRSSWQGARAEGGPTKRRRRGA